MGIVERPDRLLDILMDAKRVAKEYYELTGRPLGITGEVGEYEVARLLGLRLAEVRQSGCHCTVGGHNFIVMAEADPFGMGFFGHGTRRNVVTKRNRVGTTLWTLPLPFRT